MSTHLFFIFFEKIRRGAPTVKKNWLTKFGKKEMKKMKKIISGLVAIG